MPIDLDNLKTQIQSILETANTTTASPDLSSGLDTRVAKVLRVNPARIPIQATWYPYVTAFVERKDVELDSIAGDQRKARRMGTAEVKLVGGVWNSTLTDETEDPADNDCEKLMENIEDVLRDNPTLNGAVLWQRPKTVTFHNVSLDEGVHLRVGILSLEAKFYY